MSRYGGYFLDGCHVRDGTLIVPLTDVVDRSRRDFAGSCENAAHGEGWACLE